MLFGRRNLVITDLLQGMVPLSALMRAVDAGGYREVTL